jgi:hypothetical protein
MGIPDYINSLNRLFPLSGFYDYAVNPGIIILTSGTEWSGSGN